VAVDINKKSIFKRGWKRTGGADGRLVYAKWAIAGFKPVKPGNL